MDGVDPLFACDGEMARRMSERDWSSTPVGPSASWSQELRTTVAILLRSRHPMILAWGEQFVVFYNDAFIPTLGAKHPDALGDTLPVVFAEVWDAVGPMQRSVLAGGAATWDEDLPLNIERGSGLEETFFTFSYSHVPDEMGPGGVLAVLTVTTDSVVSARRLALLNELISAATLATDPGPALSAALDVLAAAGSELVGGAFYGPDASNAHLVRTAQFGTPHPQITPERIVGADHAAARAASELRMVAGPPGDTVPADASPFHVAVPVSTGHADAPSVLVLVPNPLRPFDEAHAAFVGLVADEVGQILVVARDRALEQSRLASLAALDSAKTAFLSSVSHEFRTPLTLLLGPLEDVLSGRADTIERADVDDMYASAQRLLRMVNGLLDVARIEADGLVATPEPTDIAELTLDALTPFESASKRAGLVLDLRLDASLGVVEVDPGLWEKVVVNLVANALKFTQVGTITVTLDADADQLRLRVSDTGVGIPESEAAQVFERFHRVNSTGGRTIEGTGIGLSLVAEAAAAMGGTVSVSSEVGSGSVFEVTLPRLVAGTEGATSTSADRAGIEALARELSPLPRDEPVPGAVSDPSQRDRPTILVVEDNPAMRSRIMRLLAELGDVVAAADGVAALDVLRTRRIDLVVTDVMMPRLDGLGLLREIRSDELLRGTPVVLLSARAGPEAAVGALEAGADDYVVKPFTAAELLARCRTTLELAQRRAYDATARARSALLAGVSHDMQTPLAVITSTLDLLSGDDLTPAARSHAAERATVRASQLTQLVTRFLDWSRLSMNEPLPIRISSCDLRETAVRVASEHERAEVGDGPAEAVVKCDPLRTEQILHNLVDNAEKVAVSSIAIVLELAQDVVTARVVDDGAGVHPDVLPHLFEPFGPSAGPGNGLGLHVSREAARAQGGDLCLESTGPEGSVFALTVPRDQP